jgi:hypothetical protein
LPSVLYHNTPLALSRFQPFAPSGIRITDRAEAI